MSGRWAMVALLAMAGCGPPVKCTVEPMPPTEWGEERPDYRDIVCTAGEDLDTFRVSIEWHDGFDPRGEYFGHHGVEKGEVFHHPDVEIGSVETVRVEGYRKRRFTVR